MTFTEANTVEQMILDSIAPKGGGEPLKAHEDAPGWGIPSTAICVRPVGITCPRPSSRARGMT